MWCSLSPSPLCVYVWKRTFPYLQFWVDPCTELLLSFLFFLHIFILLLLSSSFFFFWSFNYRKDGNILFNNALNTFYLWLYGIEHMVKTTQKLRGNPLLHFWLEARDIYMHHPTDMTAHSMAFVTPVAERWNKK